MMIAQRVQSKRTCRLSANMNTRLWSYFSLVLYIQFYAMHAYRKQPLIPDTLYGILALSLCFIVPGNKQWIERTMIHSDVENNRRPHVVIRFETETGKYVCVLAIFRNVHKHRYVHTITSIHILLVHSVSLHISIFFSIFFVYSAPAELRCSASIRIFTTLWMSQYCIKFLFETYFEIHMYFIHR